MFYKASDIIAEGKKNKQGGAFKEIGETFCKLESGAVDEKYTVFLFNFMKTNLVFIPFSYAKIKKAFEVIAEECNKPIGDPLMERVIKTTAFCAIVFIRLVIKTFAPENVKDRLLKKQGLGTPYSAVSLFRVCGFNPPSKVQQKYIDLLKIFYISDLESSPITVDVDLLYLCLEKVEANLEHSGKLL